jgi:hypothetical protein
MLVTALPNLIWSPLILDPGFAPEATSQFTQTNMVENCYISRA